MAAKKKIEPVKPVVSRVPLPATDSALVIDLPDGQKLVVGKMGQGTVIEVATWRGVGRPDSRTSRMMFGMSSAEIDEEGETKEVEIYSDSPENPLLRILNYPITLLKWLFNIQSEPKPKKNKDGSKKLIIDNNPELAKSKKSKIDLVKPKIIRTYDFVSKWAKAVFDHARAFVLTKLKKEAKAPKAQSDELDIEKWLDSLNTKASSKSTKELPREISAPKAKSKK